MTWWLKTPLWARVLGGLVLGGLFGLLMRKMGMSDQVTQFIKPFGDAFVRLIRMLIVPLIFSTLVAGVIAMGDPKKLGSLGGKAIALYLATTAIAVCLGLGMGTLVQPGVGVKYEMASVEAVAEVEQKLERAEAAGGITARLLHIIPKNPVMAFAQADVLAVIFFSILFGVGILLTGKKGAPMAKIMDSASDIMIRITELVMQTAPFGVFALMAWVMATQGLDILDNLLKLAFALYLACFLQIIFVYGGIIRVLLRLPLIRFFRGVLDAQATAYSTASSAATLPVTIACVSDNLGVSKSVAGSILPLGATINMDGTAIYLGIVALFAAQALGIDLTMGHYVMVALFATLASIGAAGIPSAGLFLAASVLSVFGVTDEQAVLVIAFILPFDRLLDMMRTVTNITGDAAIATMIAKSEGELDEKVFREVAKV